MSSFVDYSTPLDYFTAIMTALGTTSITISSIYSIYHAWKRATNLSVLAAIFTSIMFIAQIFTIVFYYFYPDYSVLLIVYLGANLSGIFFLFAQSETIQLVITSQSRAQMLMFCWRIVHIVMHVLLAMPLYIADPISYYAFPDNYLIIDVTVSLLEIVWTLYAYSFDIANSIWLARKMYEFSRQTVEIRGRTKTSNITSTENKSNAANNDMAKVTTVEETSREEMLKNVKKYFNVTIITLVVMATIDFFCIFLQIMTAILSNSTDADSIHASYLTVICSLSLVCMHYTGAVIIYKLLVLIFRAEDAPKASKSVTSVEKYMLSRFMI